MATLVAVLACIALVAIGELVRFGVARALRLPTTRVAKLFVGFRGGPRWARVVAIFAGSIAIYLSIVLLAFGLFVLDGLPTEQLDVRVADVPAGYPATGKLARGDLIIAIDGEPLTGSLSLAIDRRNGAPVRLTIRRRDGIHDVTLQPIGHDGHWIVGIRPAFERARTYDAAVALQRAFELPIAFAQELVPEPAADAPQPGGPIRIIDELPLEVGAGVKAITKSLFYGVYVLLLMLAIDLARAVRAVTRKD